MGKKSLLCDGCGKPIEGEEPRRGLAHTPDRRHFCAPCLPLFNGPPRPTLPVAGVETRPFRRTA